MCSVKGPDFHRFFPCKHCGHLLHQDVFLCVKFVFYVFASETRIIFVAIFYLPIAELDLCANVLHHSFEKASAWAHKDDVVILTFVETELCKKLPKNYGFWRIVNRHGNEHGLLPSLKLFKHKFQCPYSKRKGLVDGSTQYRTNLHFPSSNLKWEQEPAV